MTPSRKASAPVDRRAAAQPTAAPDSYLVTRPVPHNLEAEKSVLGVILLHSDAFDRVAPILHANDFFREAHRRIFRVLQTLIVERRVTADFVTVNEELSRRGELTEVGGPGYISALTDGLPRSTNVEHYAEVVKEKATLRGLILTGNAILASAYEAAAPASEQITAADRAIIDLQTGHGAGRLMDFSATASALMTNLEHRCEHRGQVTGVPTGFDSIDQLTMGWQPGDLVVIAARPSIGKTTLAINSATAAARAGRRVAVFSLEMRRQQLEYRILSSLSSVKLTRLLGGYLHDEDWPRLTAAIAEMEQLGILIDDRGGQTVWDIRTACRRIKSEKCLDLVVVDYVQLMPGSLDRRSPTRNEEVTDISRRLKQLADDCAVPVLLLSQLNRAGEGRADPRPKLSDLRESGALEQDADLVCFLHRKNHKESGPTEFILEKARNGPTGTLMLTVDRETTTFTDGGEAPVEAPAPKPVAVIGGEPAARRLPYRRRSHAN